MNNKNSKLNINKKTVDQAAHDIESPLAILLILAQQCIGFTKEKAFEMLKTFASFIPIGIYWLDTNNIVIGANKNAIAIVGGKSIDDFLGKTPYEYYPHEMADCIVQHNNKVIKEKKTLSQEEKIIDATTGEIKYFIAYKTPLFDDNENVIGVLGTSVDITTEKLAEEHKKQSEFLSIEIEKQKEIIKLADQVSHDIRSPARSMYSMIENNADKIPEDIRISLRDTATNIIDVASSLIGRYEKGRTESGSGVEESQPIIASLSLMQILSEKKVQYTSSVSVINFTSEYSNESKLAFIKVQPSYFKRMISNLLNNAIEALDGKKGIIHLGLSVDEIKKDLRITIQDNGRGMSEEIASKIRSGATVATDKKEGHGIGLTQIREAIANNRGKFDITSKLGEGTTICVTFPLTTPPQWLAKDIKLNLGDTVVVLDDDTSIHGVWDSYFKAYLDKLQLKHFIIGTEAINFINTFPDKNKIFLLTDYELMKQGITGIDVIQKTDIFERSILVTSHYTDTKLQQQIIENGIRMLPKDLASGVSMHICESNEKCSLIDSRKVNIVICEDDELLANIEAGLFRSKNKQVDVYYNPDNFLKNISKYDHNTIMCIDNEFKDSKLSGFDVAKQLHEQGFTRLYLVSGREFERDKVPEYLTTILKDDIDTIVKLTES